jgi:hypothetical protein
MRTHSHEEMTMPGAIRSRIDTEWKELHERLRSIAKRRVALEAEEATWLIEAEDTRLYRRLGYTTMIEYMERELYWGPHAANERLRVARELIELPLIAELFADGELCFSAVRELTRVATPATEEAFLRKAQGKTAHQIQAMVAGLKRGDQPDDRPDPRLIKKRVVIEVSAETYATWRQTRTALEGESNERLSDDAFLQMLCRRATEPTTTDDVARPMVQTAVTTCKACKQSTIAAGGEALPIDVATAARLFCDSQHIGDLESDELTRLTTAIPMATRRKVFHRDNGACAVPGCRSTRHLTIHHIRAREHGGDHSMTNLVSICSGCHQRLHAGYLTITGLAPDLEFTWQRDDDVDSAMLTSPRWDWEPHDRRTTAEVRMDE